jgi:hypothetical protein
MRLLRRLEDLEKAIRFREPRLVVFTVPTGDDGVRTPETETALIEIKRQHGVTDDDLVVEVANYGAHPEALPQLVSITST